MTTNSKHKIVVAGCGGMSNQWLDYVAQRDDAEIVGLVDIRIESAQAMAEKRGLQVPSFTNLGQALAETGANLVFDITIPASHKLIVTTALEAGCNVLGEKPMAEEMEDAREILRVADRTGKRYAVMQNRRFLKQIRALRETLREGTIGTVGALHADFFLGPHFGGFRDAMDHPLILDMAIHTFDQARLISGADPVSVYCHEYNPPGSWYQGNSSAICIFEMSDGSVFNYRGSWSAEGFSTSWESDWRITGSKGTARWDGTNHPVCEVVDESQPSGWMNPQKKVEVPDFWKGQEGHPGCLDEMFASLEENRKAETDASDNIKSMAMVFGAMESAKTGRKVQL
jgi:predicted dehydrogenase